MKKVSYIFAFGFLGLLVATLVHGMVEIFAIDFIFENPERFSDTFWWNEWSTLHAIGGGALWVVGLLGGLYAGVKFWEIVYVKKHATS